LVEAGRDGEPGQWKREQGAEAEVGFQQSAAGEQISRIGLVHRSILTACGAWRQRPFAAGTNHSVAALWQNGTLAPDANSGLYGLQPELSRASPSKTIQGVVEFGSQGAGEAE
jgi:hypothetical protein